MRWWWFGPAVAKPELTRELKVMRDAGIGGVEIQPIYPLQLDDPEHGVVNHPYLSPAFLDDLRFAAATANSLGLKVSITLGSGWPFGGPQTPVTEAAGKLRFDQSPSPALENGERMIAPHFISSRTGQQVKRASVGAEGFVLDHYDSNAIKHHLQNVGDKLLAAFGSHPPTSVFSDSLEVFGTDWTPDLPRQFKARRGYDLISELSALVSDPPSEHDRAVRHDWALTLSELADENFLQPINTWAHQHHTLFRSQTYGEPPVTLSSNRLVDLPEGEAGPKWRTFSTARWASSASHLYGRQVTSTETWTWLHSPAFRATPLDMKAEADLHFLQGINQLVGHGWPYSPPGAIEPGQRLYAAAAFNEHNPWFLVMPEIAAYLQRLSYLLRQGEPANDIALYLPTSDAFAASKPGKVTVDRQMESLLDPALIPSLLDAGYNFDFVDDTAILNGKLHSKVFVLPAVTRMPLATLNKLREYRAKGGLLVAAGRLPSLSPGLVDAESLSAKVTAAAGELFKRGDDKPLAEMLHQLLPPDLKSDPAIGFIHRHLPASDVYFLANTTNHPVKTQASFRTQRAVAERWDPFTGATCKLEGTALPLALEPYESFTFVLTDASHAPACESLPATDAALNLDSDWRVTFEHSASSAYDHLHSWTDDANTKFYSGRATYEKTIQLAIPLAQALLDFGHGEPVMDTQAGPNMPGMRALLESPIREAAVVYVNGQRAGSVWHPPYQLDIMPFLHNGNNHLKIVVANTAMNTVAGHALPRYKLLNQRYGERFVPQGFDRVKPLSSGMLPGLRLRQQ